MDNTISTAAPEQGEASPARIIPRARHPISRKKIAANALKILYRLKNHGYAAYLAGGAVRDLLLGRQPADFDIVTDATPKQIRRLFRNSRIIGRRFRLVHVFFYRPGEKSPEIFEVATFRRPALPGQDDPELLRSQPALANNLFGTPAEDARRRDFTINALFYNLTDFTVIDYVNGMRDLEEGVIRIIGDPVTRFAEDPVRVLRALEFACRLNFTIAAETGRVLGEAAAALATVPPARMHEELKGFYLKRNLAAVIAAGERYRLNQHWLPPFVNRTASAILPLLEKIENKFPLTGHEKELERVVLAALLLPSLLAEFPLEEPGRLNRIQERAGELLLELNHRFHLPRVQRYGTCDLLIILYRLGRGDKRLKQLSRRENFGGALFLYIVLATGSPEQSSNLAFWRDRCKRLSQQPNTLPFNLEELVQISQGTKT